MATSEPKPTFIHYDEISSIPEDAMSTLFKAARLEIRRETLRQLRLNYGYDR